MWRDRPTEHKTPGTGPLRCLSLGKDAGGGQSWTLTRRRVWVTPHPVTCASPVYDCLCPRVCCWGGRGHPDLCGQKPEAGGGGGFREPGWDGTSWGSLNHIRAAMGRLPGAWRAEREAHASDLSAPPPFDLLASLERLPPPPLGAVARGLEGGLPAGLGLWGLLTLGCVGSFFLSCVALLALFPSPCLTGLAPLPKGAGQAPGHCVASPPQLLPP